MHRASTVNYYVMMFLSLVNLEHFKPTQKDPLALTVLRSRDFMASVWAEHFGRLHLRLLLLSHKTILLLELVLRSWTFSGRLPLLAFEFPSA